jgi:hypothetical protein
MVEGSGRRMTDYLGNVALAMSAPGTYQILEWELDTTEGKQVERATPLGGDWPISSNIRFNGTATLTMTIKVVGTSTDDLTTKLRTLRVEALKPLNVYVHYPVGSSTPIAFTVLECLRQPVTESVSYGLVYWERQKLQLLVAPYSEGALQILHDATAINAPAALPLAALLGDLPTPVRVATSVNASNNIRSMYMSLAPTVLSQDMWLLDEGNARWTWTGQGSTAALANSYGGSTRRNSSTGWAIGTIDSKYYPGPGKYLAIARVMMVAGQGYIKESYNNVEIPVSRTSMHYVELGEIWLPAGNVRRGSSTTAPWSISFRSDGSNLMHLDYVLLLPISYGFWGYHPAANIEVDHVEVGPEGVYVGDVTDWTYMVGDVLRPRLTAMLCPQLNTTGSPSGTTWPTDWYRSNATDITATASRFQIVSSAAAAREAWPPVTSEFKVSPESLYELGLAKRVTSRTASSISVLLRWFDVAGNLIGTDTLATYSVADGGDVTGLVFGRRAPKRARGVRPVFSAQQLAGITTQFWNVVFRQAPLQLLIAAENAAGGEATRALTITVDAVPRFEGAR